MSGHYYSYCAAEKFASDESYYKPSHIDVEKEEYAFEGNVHLIERTSNPICEILPKNTTPISLSCFLVKNENDGKFVHQYSFLCENHMTNCLNVKAKTRGLNSDRFGENNFYEYLGSNAGDWEIYMAIGKDRHLKLPDFNSSNVDLSQTDIDLVLYDERSRPSKPNDGPREFDIPDLATILSTP